MNRSWKTFQARPGRPDVTPAPPNAHLETHIFRRKSFLGGFLEPKLEAKARSSQATAVREVAKSCRKSAICLDFKEGYKHKNIYF